MGSRLVQAGAEGAPALLHMVRHALRPERYARANPYRVGTIDPQRITHLTRDRMRLEGRRVPGDWDREMAPISAMPLFRGLTQRFVGGRHWLETELHPDRYIPYWPDRSKRYVGLSIEAFLARGAALDELYASLRAHGYLNPRHTGHPIDEVMALAIGRDGTVARNRRGLHRLILSQILGLDGIPARIAVVHTELEDEQEWLRF